jgi:spermidine/putrescine transport system ATP-binding protein
VTAPQVRRIHSQFASAEGQSPVATKNVSTGQVEDLHLVNLTKRFGAATAVDDLSLTIPAGSFFALLGPSGCGKTTTLRMVAGLEDPTEGRILIGDQDVTLKKPYQRPVNTVFQNYALFPHLDINENIAFGLRRQGVKDVKERVANMLELVQLAEYGKRKPGQLSGGQQQRIAVARALINRPDVLLLDEPLGALDLKLRRQMQLELKRIQVEVGTTFVHVTHDQEEAMTMADTVAVMVNGQIEQMGAPEEMYELPKTVFVSNFLGQSNLLEGRVVDRSGDDLVVEAAGSRYALPSARSAVSDGPIVLGIRPEKLTIGPQSAPLARPGDNVLEGTVVDASFVGVSTQYLVRTASGADIVAFEQNMATGERIRRGDQVRMSWEPGHSFGLEVPGEGLVAAAEAAAVAAGV